MIPSYGNRTPQPAPAPSQPANPLPRCTITMLNRETMRPEFELIIYGRTAAQLMTVPNDVIGSISSRYPNHISTIFHVDDSLPASYNFSPRPPDTAPGWQEALAAELQTREQLFRRAARRTQKGVRRDI